MSATGPTAVNFTSTWASPTTISARQRRCRSNCCRTIGARPIRHRRPRTTRWPTLNLTGKVEATPTWTIDGSVRVRAFRQKTVDGNPTETERMRRRSGVALLQQLTTVAGKWPQRGPTRKSLPRHRSAGADRPDINPFDDDRGDPAGNQYRPVVRAQQPVHGRHQFRLRCHPLRGQRGIGHDRSKLRRQRQRHIPRPVRRVRFRSVRSRFAPPTGTPDSMRSTRST